MMKFAIVDRRIYLYEGKWRNPSNDMDEPIYYYYLQPLTMAIGTDFGKQTVRPTALIGVWGEHHFVKGDLITLHDGMQLQVTEQTFVYREGNIKVRHLLKSKVQETQVQLQ
jgi:hypothetical protein